MYDKENKLIDSYTAGRMSRRELFKGLGALVRTPVEYCTT